MTVRRLHITTPQTSFGNLLANLLFGSPEAQAFLAQRSPSVLKLIQPQPTTPLPGITRFAPEPLLPGGSKIGGPRIGGGTWASVIVGLGLMYLAPDLERWLRTPPIGDLRPTPEEGIEGLLRRLQEETERAIDLANKAAELRRLMEWGDGDSGRAWALRQEMAVKQPDHRDNDYSPYNRVEITNSAGGGESPAASYIRFTSPDDAVLELPPGMAPPSVLKLLPTMRRPMVLRIAGEDPQTGRAYYGLRRLT